MIFDYCHVLIWIKDLFWNCNNKDVTFCYFEQLFIEFKQFVGKQFNGVTFASTWSENISENKTKSNFQIF